MTTPERSARQQGSTGLAITFRVLGPVEVWSAAGEPIPIKQRVHRAALALMLLRVGDTCPRAWLCQAIWGKCLPASGPSALRTTVYGLRRELAALGCRLRTRQAGPNPGGYAIAAAEDEVDLQVFRALADAGRAAWYRGDVNRAAGALGEALRLWRGLPADLPATPAAGAEASRLREEFRNAQDVWMDARLSLGQHHEAAPELRRILIREPLREHVWAQLMLALYRCGDSLGAQSAFYAARAALIAEYGAEPGPELAELHRQVLADSPALGAGSWQKPDRLPAPRSGGRQGRDTECPAESARGAPLRHVSCVSRAQRAHRDGKLIGDQPGADMRRNLRAAHGRHRRVEVHGQVAVADSVKAHLAAEQRRGRPEEFRCAGGQRRQGLRGLRRDLIGRAVQDRLGAAVAQDGGADPHGKDRGLSAGDRP